MQVLASSPPREDSVLDFLPDGLPGQVHSSGSSGTAAGEPFSLFSVPIAAQRNQTAGRQQQPAQQSRFDDVYASAEQQVPMPSAIPLCSLAVCITCCSYSGLSATSAEHLLLEVKQSSLCKRFECMLNSSLAKLY